MRFGIFVLMAGSALAPTQDPSVAGRQDPPRYRASAELVIVHVLVLSEDEPATGLRIEDFRITEEGHERPISVLIGPEDEQAREYVLAVDASGSMGAWPTKQSTNLILDSLKPGSCVLFLPFQEQVLGGVWGHPGDRSLRSRVLAMELNPERRAALYDALVVSISVMRNRVSTDEGPSLVGPPTSFVGLEELMRFRGSGSGDRRQDMPEFEGTCQVTSASLQGSNSTIGLLRSIMLLTDGGEVASHTTFDDVLLAAWGSSLPVYVLAAEPGLSSGDFGVMGRASNLGHLRNLERLTEFTGGYMFRAVRRPPDYEEVWDQLQRLIRSLKAHYVLGYVPERMDAKDPPVMERRAIKVEVRRPGFEVLTQSHIVRGSAAAENAALDDALRGFRQINAGLAQQALVTFDSALSTAPELAPALYGRAIALTLLGQPSDALEALRQAARRAPWLPDLDARQAELLIETGDLDGAWSHALRAHAAGSRVDELIARLQQLAPRQVTLTGPQAPLAISLQATGERDLIAQTSVVPVVLAAVGTVLLDSPYVVVAGDQQEPDLRLLLDIDRVRQRGRAISLDAALLLREGDGDKLLEVPLTLPDVRSGAALQAAVAEAMRRIEAAIIGYRASTQHTRSRE